MRIFLILTLIFSFKAHSQSASPKLKSFFKDKTNIENPFNLRDPFKAPIEKRTDKSRDGYRITGKGQYSNIAEAPLNQLQTGELRLVGVLIGKERRAMVSMGKDSNGKIVILKEGMKIGQEEAELKAILPGGIILVEKIINVYGEEEYLETVVPISK